MGVKGAGILDLSYMGRRAEGGTRIDPLERIAADIAAIREQHVVPPLMLHTPVTLIAAGDEKTFDSQSSKVSWLICQAFTGVVDVYWSYAGGSLPPMQFAPTPFPILIPLSTKEYTFTCVANGGPATFSITMVA